MTINQKAASVRYRRCAAVITAILLLTAPIGAQTATLAPSPKFTGFDSNGDPISAGKLCTYTAGTATPATTYTSSTLSASNTNPVILDSAGRADVWLVTGATYKFVLRTAGSDTTCATGTVVWTVDNIGAVPTTSNNLDVLGTAGEAITAGAVVYLSDGSGSKTAGQWFLADADLAYASAAPILGMAPSAIASGIAGTMRLQGIVTGLSSLTVGTTYYLSATAGALVSTVPVTHARVVGVADTTSSLVLNANPNVPPVNAGACQGRLTLTSATPVTIADVTGATTVYWTPYLGNQCAVYDGTRWIARTFTEMSIALPATTVTIYDVYLIDTAGTLGLELAAWTNDTTPAFAHSGATFYQDGVAIKAGSATKRYLGSVRTTAVSGQTEDSLAKRYLWNYYNRKPRPLRVLETTDTWTYSLAAYRQANASTANQLDLVVGVADVMVSVDVLATFTNTNAAIDGAVGVGEDSTTTVAPGTLQQNGSSVVGNFVMARATLQKAPAIGRHFYAWLEYSVATPTTTWRGDTPTGYIQSGIYGWIEG